MTVHVGLANEDGFPHEGKLEFVDNQLDTAHRQRAHARHCSPTSDRTLAPGLFARVQIGGGSAQPGACLISDRAVGTDQNRKFVFVVGADGKAEYRAVTLGPVVDGLRVVRDGLKPGEKIVVNGLQRVHPGAPITAQVVPMEASPMPSRARASWPWPTSRPRNKQHMNISRFFVDKPIFAAVLSVIIFVAGLHLDLRAADLRVPGSGAAVGGGARPVPGRQPESDRRNRRHAARSSRSTASRTCSTCPRRTPPTARCR